MFAYSDIHIDNTYYFLNFFMHDNRSLIQKNVSNSEILLMVKGIFSAYYIIMYLSANTTKINLISNV